MAKAFHDMPDDFRMKIRDIVYEFGGMVAGYYDGSCQVALPSDRDKCREMTQELEHAGMVADSKLVWFPLGSDNPPDSLRHHGIGTASCPIGERPSYWKYRNFYVEAE